MGVTLALAVRLLLGRVHGSGGAMEYGRRRVQRSLLGEIEMCLRECADALAKALFQPSHAINLLPSVR